MMWYIQRVWNINRCSLFLKNWLMVNTLFLFGVILFLSPDAHLVLGKKVSTRNQCSDYECKIIIFWFQSQAKTSSTSRSTSLDKFSTSFNKSLDKFRQVSTSFNHELSYLLIPVWQSVFIYPQFVQSLPKWFVTWHVTYTSFACKLSYLRSYLCTP